MARQENFNRSFLGYNKKDVDEKIIQMQQEFDVEKKSLIAQQQELISQIAALRKKSADLNKRNDEFNDIEENVFSIMNIAQRAGEKVYAKSSLCKDKILAIADESVLSVEQLRNEIVNVQKTINDVILVVQNRLDTVNLTLTNAIKSLEDVKDIANESQLTSDFNFNIKEEVDELLQENFDYLGVSPLNDSSMKMTKDCSSRVISLYADNEDDWSAIEDEIKAIADAVENTDVVIPKFPNYGVGGINEKTSKIPVKKNKQESQLIV